MLYANDDVGKEYLAGVHDGLGDKAATMIVKEVSYEDSDADSTQIVALKDSGADVFLNFRGPFATEAIRAAYDLGWHPLQFIPNASLSIAAFLDPAGLEKSAGIITNARSKGWLSRRVRTTIPPCASFSIGWANTILKRAFATKTMWPATNAPKR